MRTGTELSQFLRLFLPTLIGHSYESTIYVLASLFPAAFFLVANNFSWSLLISMSTSVCIFHVFSNDSSRARILSLLVSFLVSFSCISVSLHLLLSNTA